MKLDEYMIMSEFFVFNSKSSKNNFFWSNGTIR